MNNQVVKFYQKNWFIWLSLFLFAPLGIILLWANKKYSKSVRIVFSVIFSLLFVFVVIINNDSKTTQGNNLQSNVVENDIQNTQESQEETVLSSEENDRNINTKNTDTVKQKNNTIVYDVATIIRTVDGDTIEVNIGERKEKVRLIGVNTPETKHPSKEVEVFGVEASNYTNKQLYSDRKVYLEKDVSDRDKYGRLLRYVWLELPQDKPENELKSKCFNAILVAEGYAQVATYPPDVKYSEYFVKFQKEAQELGKGLWGVAEKNQESIANINTNNNTNNTSSDIITKIELSDGKQYTLNPDTKYVGSSGSNKYHRINCRWAKKINPQNLVQFKSKEDAESKNYAPCKECNP